MNSVDTRICRRYIRFNVPSDQIVGSAKQAEAFCKDLGLYEHGFDNEWVLKRLIALRKSGKLPRIRDGHGAAEGSGGGHGKDTLHH